jgi:hypothetical protein
MTDRARSTKLLKAMKFLISYKFIAIVMVILLMIHLSIWLVMTGILTVTGPENLYSAGGCNSGNNVYFTGGMILFYVCIIAVMFVIIAKEWKEPYLIRIEMIAVAITVMLSLIPFLITNFVEAYVSQ